MNKVFLIGNLTADPETRSTRDGVCVCSFTLAVNRRKEGVDYFRVTAWRQLAEICGKFLQKGRKAAVAGSVSVSTYTTREGQTRASMDVTADEVEFLTPRDEAQEKPETDKQTGFVQVKEDLPF